MTASGKYLKTSNFKIHMLVLLSSLCIPNILKAPQVHSGPHFLTCGYYQCVYIYRHLVCCCRTTWGGLCWLCEGRRGVSGFYRYSSHVAARWLSFKKKITMLNCFKVVEKEWIFYQRTFSFLTFIRCCRNQLSCWELLDFSQHN